MTRIEIFRDYDVDEDNGEVGDYQDVFWCEGHGLDPAEVIRAAVDHAIDEDQTIPRIGWDDGPEEMWQRDTSMGGSVLYHRRSEPGSPARDWRPVTVLDLRRSFLGATCCSVRGCMGQADRNVPISALWEPDGPHRTLDTYLCATHRDEFPSAYYRLYWVPVGATILLPQEADQ